MLLGMLLGHIEKWLSTHMLGRVPRLHRKILVETPAYLYRQTCRSQYAKLFDKPNAGSIAHINPGPNSNPFV